MGKKDVVSKIYLGAADRIADLLNNELFEGGSAVAASDIMELDSIAASTLKDERHRAGGLQYVQSDRYDGSRWRETRRGTR